MRTLSLLAYAAAALFGLLIDSEPALAQREPVIVVPGRPGYQVMFWGRDVSGAVIEGEFGLDRPGNVGFTVIPPQRPYSSNADGTSHGYFPTTGEKPAYGRLEVVPPPDRALPPPAPSFFRSWTSESPRLPATVEPPGNPPPIILAPRVTPPAASAPDSPPGRGP